MKRVIVICILMLGFVAAFADGLQGDALYKELQSRQKRLNFSQDSLRSALNVERTKFEDAPDTLRDVISQTIVRLEGEIYDVRAQLGRLGGQIATIEQQYAEQSLQAASTRPQVQSAVLYDNTFFKDNLSATDIAKLKSLTTVADNVIATSAPAISQLYGQLSEIKAGYDNSISQSEVDELGRKALDIQQQIRAIDKQIGDSWKSVYDFALEQYLVLLDKSGVQDRSLLETLESEGRRVRRAESIAEQESISPNYTSFDAQRAIVLTYEKALASTLELSSAANALAARKIVPISATLPYLTFEPRVLTIYGTISTGVESNSDNVNEIPQAIIPTKGNYYSVQVALTNSKPKDMSMFKGAYPLQVQQTSDGKYRYMAGGFTNYAAAQKGVNELYKAGFKYPQIVGWRDGKWATPSKIKGYDVVPKTIADESGRFVIKISTKEVIVGEKLREVVDANAKGKNIARIANGDMLEFTVTEFDSLNVAEALAQIIRLNVTPDVVVEKLK